MAGAMRVRKKPVEVEACRVPDGPMTSTERAEEWGAVLGFLMGRCDFEVAEGLGLDIITLEGTMRADLGDYIIRGVKGEFYPCKPDVFEATYDVVGDLSEAITDILDREAGV